MPGVIIKITHCYSYPLIFGTRHLDSWTSLVKTQTYLIPRSFPFYTVSCENIGWVPYSHPGCGLWWVSQTEKLWPVVRGLVTSLHHIYFLGVHIWSVMSDSVTPRPVAHQAPLSMQDRVSRKEYWSGLPLALPGDLPNPGIKPASPVFPALQADSLTLIFWFHSFSCYLLIDFPISIALPLCFPNSKLFFFFLDTPHGRILSFPTRRDPSN